MRAGTTLLALLVASACGDGGSAGPDADRRDAGPCEAFPLENEGWMHVPEDSTIDYQHNPPASGPHYPVWLRYQAYTTAQARPYYVHNLEHGAIVLVHRPDAAPALIASLTDTFRALPNDAQCGHPRALLTPDPLLTRPVAAIAANFVLEGDCVSPDAIRRFTLAHRNQAPENICDSGTRP